jgi:hypothetical protein
MSRAFNGGTSADCITFAPGGAPTDQGNAGTGVTIGVLAKASTVAGFTMWAITGRKAGTRVWSILTSNNVGPKLFAENDFSNGVSGLSTSWRWYVMTKASGSAIPRWHIWDLSGAWSHTNTDAAVGNNTGAIDEILLGLDSVGTTWRGSMAVAATFNTALSDGAIEANFTLSAAHLLAATPTWMVRLNQASTATSVTDDTSGGGGQTALSGTTVDADDPPGYDYSLTPPTFTGTVTLAASQALTLAGTVTYTGAATLAASQALTLAGTVSYASTVSMGVTQALSAAGALASTTSMPVSQGLTLAGLLSYSVAFPLTVDLSLAGTVSGGTVETPSGWETIRGAINEAKAQHLKHEERRRRPIDCPVHLWPLEIKGNIYHCKFGGHIVRLPAPSP